MKGEVDLSQVKVRVLVRGYLECPRCGNIDNTVPRGGILDGVFCCTFMEPVGEYVEMSQAEWIEKNDTLFNTSGWEKDYKVLKREAVK